MAKNDKQVAAGLLFGFVLMPLALFGAGYYGAHHPSEQPPLERVQADERAESDAKVAMKVCMSISPEYRLQACDADTLNRIYGLGHPAPRWRP